MSGIQQAVMRDFRASTSTSDIGQPYAGGFIGGKINVSGTLYYLLLLKK